MLTPLAVAVNAIPIVVIVPILNNMLFGTTSQVPRRLMVMLIVFFVVFVNVSKGLRQVSATHLELMRSYAATPTEILLQGRAFPNAVGYLFTAMRIAAPLAVITAFVAEYFGGVQNGLATGVRNSLNGSKDVTWAYVIGASALGLTFYLVSSGLERLHGGRHELGLNIRGIHQHTNTGRRPDDGGRPPKGRDIMKRSITTITAGVCALALVAGACGSDDAATDDTAADTTTADGRRDEPAGRRRAMRRRRRRRATDCETTDSVSLQLQWFTQAQFGGYYAAIDQGFYADQCLDVEINEGARRDRPAGRTRQRQRRLRDRVGAQGTADA